MPELSPMEEIAQGFRENFGFDRRDKKHLEKLKDVLAQTGKKRWQAAAELYFMVNPVSVLRDPETNMPVKTLDARSVNAIIIRDNEKTRKGLDMAHNSLGTSTDGNSSRRFALSMPPGLLEFLELIDPDLLSGTSDERKNSLRELARAFPAYKIYKTI